MRGRTLLPQTGLVCAGALPLLYHDEDFFGRRGKKPLVRKVKVEPRSIKMRIGDDSCEGRRGRETVNDIEDAVLLKIMVCVLRTRPHSQFIIE
jgi:hypothetical protein